MRHICVSKLTIIVSDNGLSPDRRQAIIWTNAGLLLIGPLGTNFSEILMEILTFSFKKMRLKMSSAKRRPFCLGLYVLRNNPQVNRAQRDTQNHDQIPNAGSVWLQSPSMLCVNTDADRSLVVWTDFTSAPIIVCNRYTDDIVTTAQLVSITCCYYIEVGTKWMIFCRRHLQRQFIDRKLLYFE